jgi:hypothetical protein
MDPKMKILVDDLKEADLSEEAEMFKQAKKSLETPPDFSAINAIEYAREQTKYDTN